MNAIAATVIPQLLVSVRSPEEARAAIAGGCDVLDIKEPARGSLGMAPAQVIVAVCRVADSHFSLAGSTSPRSASEVRVPVSAALGETLDWDRDGEFPRLSAGLRFVKLGTAGLGTARNWQSQWSSIRQAFDVAAQRSLAWIAVAYADWKRADAPCPEHVMQAAVETGCTGVLFDTFHKDGRTLFDALPSARLEAYIDELRGADRLVALAGSLSEDDILTARTLSPDVIAVRTAACADGRRDGPVTASAVRRICDRLRRSRIEATR